MGVQSDATEWREGDCHQSTGPQGPPNSPRSVGLRMTTAHSDQLPCVSTVLLGAAAVRAVASHTLSTCTVSGRRRGTARECGNADTGLRAR